MRTLLASSVWANWSLGNFTIIDLIAASTNAFNAALLARRPTHWRYYTIVGIILLAILGGIAGGVSRDVILNDVPAALTNPWYLILCLGAAGIALMIHYRVGQAIRDGLFQFMTAFSLPWYAAVGANKALEADQPYIAAVLIGVLGATAGRYLVDLTSGVTPKLFVRGEWFVGTAVLASVLYVVADAGLGLSIWSATLLAVGISFVFRLLALLFAWEEPEPWEPPAAREGEPIREPLGEAIHREFGHEQRDEKG